MGVDACGVVLLLRRMINGLVVDRVVEVDDHVDRVLDRVPTLLLWTLCEQRMIVLFHKPREFGKKEHLVDVLAVASSPRGDPSSFCWKRVESKRMGYFFIVGHLAQYLTTYSNREFL